jgi:hypothetical protein
MSKAKNILRPVTHNEIRKGTFGWLFQNKKGTEWEAGAYATHPFLSDDGFTGGLETRGHVRSGECVE